jgi:hypothetical protein
VTDLLINLLASVIAGTAVWAAQRALRIRRLARKRAFFGLVDEGECLLAVSRHASSPHENSVHRRDVAALVELTTIAKDCGSRVELVSQDATSAQIGRVTEFSVGGPFGNVRAATHLRTLLHGFNSDEEEVDGNPVMRVAYNVGDQGYHWSADREYMLLARAWGPAGGRPVFVLAGQTAGSNLAAARYLARNHRELYRKYGADKPFALMLCIVEPATYGSDFTELVADVTADAFRPTQGQRGIPRTGVSGGA